MITFKKKIRCYVWMKVPQRFTRKDLVLRMVELDAVDLQEAQPSGRSFGHWGMCPWRDCRTPVSVSFCSLAPEVGSHLEMWSCHDQRYQKMGLPDFGLDPPIQGVKINFSSQANMDTNLVCHLSLKLKRTNDENVCWEFVFPEGKVETTPPPRNPRWPVCPP